MRRRSKSPPTWDLVRGNIVKTDKGWSTGRPATLPIGLHIQPEGGGGGFGAGAEDLFTRSIGHRRTTLSVAVLPLTAHDRPSIMHSANRSGGKELRRAKTSAAPPHTRSTVETGATLFQFPPCSFPLGCMAKMHGKDRRRAGRRCIPLFFASRLSLVPQPRGERRS